MKITNKAYYINMLMLIAMTLFVCISAAGTLNAGIQFWQFVFYDVFFWESFKQALFQIFGAATCAGILIILMMMNLFSQMD